MRQDYLSFASYYYYRYWDRNYFSVSYGGSTAILQQATTSGGRYSVLRNLHRVAAFSSPHSVLHILLRLAGHHATYGWCVPACRHLWRPLQAAPETKTDIQICS